MIGIAFGFASGYVLVGNTFSSLRKENILYGSGFGQGDVNWTINGMLGKHGIYISPVILTSTYNQSMIAGVYYRYHDGDWELYTEPFTISIQGNIVFQWYPVDHNGNQGTVHTFQPFGIDYTPPYINVIKERISILTWRITVEAFDNVTGIDYVEFYVNGLLLTTITTPPYTWIWTQKIFEKPVIKVVVYDLAGLNANYSTTTSTDYSHSQLSSQYNSQQRNLFRSTLMVYYQMRIKQVLD